MNGMQAVTALSVYLAKCFSEDSAVRVFKYKKQTAYTGDYIVVNSLPFSTGTAQNTLNVNIHVPALSSGEVNAARLQALQRALENYIPIEDEAIENQDAYLKIEGAYFSRKNDSNPLSDTDNSFYINNKVKVICYYGN